MRVKHTGYEVINKIKAVFGSTVATDMEPKFLGKHLVTLFHKHMPKQKSRKSLTNRIKVTKNGKLLRRQSFRRHLKA